MQADGSFFIQTGFARLPVLVNSLKLGRSEARVVLSRVLRVTFSDRRAWVRSQRVFRALVKDARTSRPPEELANRSVGSHAVLVDAPSC